ncbi:CLUMA_CG008531, isoform A [Clunio marinus]|uniref:CLUMA_CG008531, isoform A n=1 Tax=Clunio marinus TaxID=568069 RepID=A0A1J1I416_9DIPT|nr:CLUMA_CG008531, isoform A [Clunio marinus]
MVEMKEKCGKSFHVHGVGVDEIPERHTLAVPEAYGCTVAILHWYSLWLFLQKMPFVPLGIATENNLFELSVALL